MREEDDQMHVYELYGVAIPRIIKATKELRAKIGPAVKITEDQVEQAQEFIEHSGLDYADTALRHIKQLEGVVSEMRETLYNREADYNMISMPIMQIKGQAGMFGNHLASILSYSILVFLEKFQRLDDAVLDIIDVYAKAIRLSYSLKLYNSETPGGKEIVSELNNALTRYQKKFIEKIEK